jgi:hypothetical protein
MSPDSDNIPTSPAKHPVHAPVVGAIAGNLGIPEAPIGFGASVAAGTTVPETAIHKNGKALLWESKIWRAGKFQVTAPAGYPVPAEQFRQGQFGGLIAACSNSGHDFGTFGPAENIFSHQS